MVVPAGKAGIGDPDAFAGPQTVTTEEWNFAGPEFDEDDDTTDRCRKSTSP